MHPLVCIQCQRALDVIPSADMEVLFAHLILTAKVKAAVLMGLFNPPLTKKNVHQTESYWRAPNGSCASGECMQAHVHRAVEIDQIIWQSWDSHIQKRACTALCAATALTVAEQFPVLKLPILTPFVKLLMEKRNGFEHTASVVCRSLCCLTQRMLEYWRFNSGNDLITSRKNTEKSGNQGN